MILKQVQSDVHFKLINLYRHTIINLKMKNKNYERERKKIIKNQKEKLQYKQYLFLYGALCKKL